MGLKSLNVLKILAFSDTERFALSSNAFDFNCWVKVRKKLASIPWGFLQEGCKRMAEIEWLLQEGWNKHNSFDLK